MTTPKIKIAALLSGISFLNLSMFALAGVYMATDRHYWSKVWVTVPLLIAIGLGALGGVFFGPKEKQLAELAQAGDAAEYDRVFGLVRRPFSWAGDSASRATCPLPAFAGFAAFRLSVLRGFFDSVEVLARLPSARIGAVESGCALRCGTWPRTARSRSRYGWQARNRPTPLSLS